MFSKISEFSCEYRMPFLSGKMIRIMLSLIKKKKTFLNGQRYRNEMLAAFTWIMSLDSSMVSKQRLRFTARLFTKTFFQTTKTPKIIFENNIWPHLAKAVLDKASFTFPRIQSAQLPTELRWQSCLTSDRERSQNVAKTFFSDISLDVYSIIDEKSKTVRLSPGVGSGLALFLFACSCSHRSSGSKVRKSRHEAEPNPTAFERNPKIGLALTSHTGDTITSSCLEGSSHNNQQRFAVINS